MTTAYLLEVIYLMIDLLHFAQSDCLLLLLLFFTAEQFLYDRNKQQNIASFITEPDIKEDDEEIDDASALAKKSELSEIDTAKLMSCIEVVRNVIGDTIPDSVLTDKIILNNFNAEAALDDILKSTPPKHQTGNFLLHDLVSCNIN